MTFTRTHDFVIFVERTVFINKWSTNPFVYWRSVNIRSRYTSYYCKFKDTLMSSLLLNKESYPTTIPSSLSVCPSPHQVLRKISYVVNLIRIYPKWSICSSFPIKSFFLAVFVSNLRTLDGLNPFSFSKTHRPYTPDTSIPSSWPFRLPSSTFSRDMNRFLKVVLGRTSSNCS